MRIIFLLSLLTLPAFGCLCDGWPSARQAWANSELVFLGGIDRANPPKAPLFEQSEQTAWVTVKEPFKGVLAGQHIVLQQDGTDCSPKFDAGSEVVLYLSPLEPGLWVAPGCHRSRSLETAADDLLFLRALPNSALSNRLSGEVDLYEDSPSLGFHKVRPFPGMRVRITSKTSSVDVYTNKDGVYEVYGLPPETYTVNIDMPAGLKLQFPTIEGIRTGLLPTNDTTVSLPSQDAVSVDFLLYEDNRISGVLLTPEGQPLKNACLYLEPAGKQPAQSNRIFDCTKQDGSFTLKDMPSGSYIIVGNRSGRVSISEPFPTAYYPGVSSKAEAEVLEITRGKAIEGLQFRLPTMARRVAVSGRVQFSDGVPVPEAYLKDSSKDLTFTSTNVDGNFSLALLADKPGELTAEITPTESVLEKCPEWKPQRDSDLLVTITSSSALITADQSGLVLTMPVRSCAAWHPVGLP